jgi:hypothetical protein
VSGEEGGGQCWRFRHSQLHYHTSPTPWAEGGPGVASGRGGKGAPGLKPAPLLLSPLLVQRGLQGGCVGFHIFRRDCSAYPRCGWNVARGSEVFCLTLLPLFVRFPPSPHSPSPTAHARTPPPNERRPPPSRRVPHGHPGLVGRVGVGRRERGRVVGVQVREREGGSIPPRACEERAQRRREWEGAWRGRRGADARTRLCWCARLGPRRAPSSLGDRAPFPLLAPHTGHSMSAERARHDGGRGRGLPALMRGRRAQQTTATPPPPSLSASSATKTWTSSTPPRPARPRARRTPTTYGGRRERGRGGADDV